MHSASALFERCFSRLAAVFFSKKTHKDLGVVLLVLTDWESGALFHFKRALVSASVFVGRSMIAPAYFFTHGRSYMSISAEEKDRYLRETAIVLARERFHTDRTHTGGLRVLLDGAPLCEVTENGGISLDYDFFHSDLLEISCGGNYTARIIPKDINIWISRLFLGDADGFSILYYQDVDSLVYWANQAAYRWKLRGMCMWSLGQEDMRLWEYLPKQI
jgi:hypothetical protein